MVVVVEGGCGSVLFFYVYTINGQEVESESGGARVFRSNRKYVTTCWVAVVFCEGCGGLTLVIKRVKIYEI